MTKASEKLLAVLLNWRTPEMTLRAARALDTALEGLDAEVVIVDNDSRDGSEQKLRAGVAEAEWHSPVRVVQSGRNGGFAFGNNAGLKAGRSDGARPDLVYFLNSDAFPEPDAVQMLRDHLAAHPEVGIVGSQLYSDDDPLHTSAFRFPTILSEFEAAACTGPISRLLARHRVPLDDLSCTQRADWFAGASMMIRQDVLDEVGTFDDGFFLYFEETELFFRAARASWQAVYVAESRVEHLGSVSTGMKHWDRVPDYWFDSRWRYFVRTHGRGYALAATGARVAGHLIRRLRRLAGTPAVEPPGTLRRLIAHTARAALAPAPDGPVAPRALTPRAAE